MDERHKTLSPNALRARAKELGSVPDNRKHRWLNLWIQLSEIERDVRERRIPLGQSLVAKDPGDESLAAYLAELVDAHREVKAAITCTTGAFYRRALGAFFDLEEDLNDGTTWRSVSDSHAATAETTGELELRASAAGQDHPDPGTDRSDDRRNGQQGAEPGNAEAWQRGPGLWEH